MNRTVVSIFVSIVCMTQFCSASDKEGLLLKIIPTKKVFLFGESVWVKFILKNTTKVPKEVIDFESKFDVMGGFYFLNSQGKEFSCIMAMPGQIGPIPTITFNPGDSMVRYYNLNIRGLSGNRYLELLKEDTYTIEVPTASSYPDNKEIISEPAKFEIKQPTGEEKQAFELLENACKYLLADEKERMGSKTPLTDTNIIKARECFHKLVDTYPRSVYAPYAQYKICTTKNFSENLSEWAETQGPIEWKKLAENYLELAEYNPSIVSYLTGSFEGAGKTDEAKKYLQEILAKYPNSNRAEKAKNILERIKIDEEKHIRALEKQNKS